MQAVCELLAGTDGLVTTLDLGMNRITDAGVKDLPETLKPNVTLRGLILGGNPFTPSMFRYLREQLKDHKSLSKLELEIPGSSKELFDAAGEKRAVDMKIALLKGANPNWSNPMNLKAYFGKPRNTTALMKVAETGFVEGMELLLRHGASVHLANDQGNTALHIAAMAPVPLLSHHELCPHTCVTMLLKHGADPTIPNSFGHTAYDLAKDQIAGDERTVLKDKSEVRAVLEEYDAERRAERRRPSKDSAPAEPLPPEGTAIAMQLEAVEDAKARESESTAKVATALAAKKFAKKTKKKAKNSPASRRRGGTARRRGARDAL